MSAAATPRTPVPATTAQAQAQAQLPAQVQLLRRFSRFYTRRIGLLHEHLLDSRFTLPESRLLWELAHHDGISAAALARELELDPGYLSRLLAGLKARGLLRSQTAPHDARQTLLRLSAAGRKAFAPLDQQSQARTAGLLASVPDASRQALVQSAATLMDLLAAPGGSVQLRPHRPGDMGWVIARHGALYDAEYGWGLRFEALVAGLCARFVEQFDARREACWIAEREGRPLGSVFLVQARDEASGKPLKGVAQLRMLLVEPDARGAGVGDRLVLQCIAFARECGYRSIMLWTNDMLAGARRLYARHGWQLVKSEPHADFGVPMVGETWQLKLGPAR
ncbi:bifunctional helix-turn-helix transcriptional regulator/GNAT family N-acetyltransferase [Aquincola tertiaricarbonis]|uniref:bifunctional helix-turn-helix transcriptional regulator/GNAT family N-acetyltransferase n=1 Tax=Aquincola tertiaricarbonis TaxID=391953 RepID=UPI0009FB1AAB|nr:helix-turn-helix domain-containing GNAT family N-acetyltransferase [Aquincola tertiaricarbonis]